MKKYVMNKNVMHSGKSYAKGQEIAKGDLGFDELVKSGHADELSFKDESPSSEPAPVEAPADEVVHVKKKGRK